MPRWPAPPATAVAEGTFEEGVFAPGGRYGGTVDVSAGGIVMANMGPPSFDDGIRFPAGLTLTTGIIDYTMRLHAGSNVSGGGFMQIILSEESTNILLDGGPTHFLAGTTPGVTVFSGQVDLGGPYTFTSNHWLSRSSGSLNNVGVDQTHWEVEVDV